MALQELKNEIPLMEYIQSLGYEFQRGQGNKYPVFYNKSLDDKICIVNPKEPYRQGYFNVRNDLDKGTLIDFVNTRCDMGIIQRCDQHIWRNVEIILSKYANKPLEERQKYIPTIQQNVDKQPIADFMKLCSAKLHKANFLYGRGITDKELKSPIFRNRIFNTLEEFGYENNIMFPLYNSEDKVVGMNQRNQNWKHFFQGSDREVGVWRSNMPETCKKVIVCEAEIDCLSYAVLYGDKDTLFIGTGGSMTQGQINTIKSFKPEGAILTLGTDNDAAGARYQLKFVLNELLEKGVKTDYLQPGPDRISLCIHDSSLFNPEMLTTQLEGYNRRSICNEYGQACQDETIHIRNENNSIVLSYSDRSYYQVAVLAQALINSAKLDLKIERPILNDWNEDVKYLRELKANGQKVSYDQLRQDRQIKNIEKTTEKMIPKRGVK